MAEESVCICGSCPDGICVGCARGGELCLPNDSDMITPRMLSEIGGGISKTRGVPSMGSTNYGPRGQRQAFRSDTDPTDDMYFSGTNWQQAGRNRETMWQEGGVFSNAAGGGRVLPTGIERTKRSGGWSDAIFPNGRTAPYNQGLLPPLPRGYSRFAGDSNGTMKTMSVSKLVMGYLAIGLTAFVIGYSIKKGKDLA